jgi:integrase
MHGRMNFREAAVEALFDAGVMADADDAVDTLVDQVGHVNRGKPGPKQKIVVEPRPGTKRKIKKLRIRYGTIRRSLGINYDPNIKIIDHPGVRMQVALFKQEIRREGYVRSDPLAMPVENVLQHLLDHMARRNPGRALTLANHVEQLNEHFAGRRLGDLDTTLLGEEYWEFRGGQQIKTELKCDDPNNRTNAKFGSVCQHLSTLRQATILVCKRAKIARIEFDMPAGYLEEVESLTWTEFRRLLRACLGFTWDPKGGPNGRGGWKTELRTDANGRTRRRYVLVDKAGRMRGAMLARFLLIYFFTGTRYSQILKLRWYASSFEPYIDFEHGEIVRDSRTDRIVTNKRRETSAILGVLLRLLEKWFAQDKAAGLDEYVIHKAGSAAPYVDLDDVIEKVAKRAGLPHFHAHMAKHSGVTFLAQLGFTSAEIAALFSTTAQVLEETYTDLGKYFQHGVVAKAEAKGFGQLAAFGTFSARQHAAAA